MKLVITHVVSVVPMDGLKHGTWISQLYKMKVGSGVSDWTMKD